MLSEDILARLSRINRERIPLLDSVKPSNLVAATPSDLAQSSPDDPDVSQLPPGSEIENAWGKHWIRERKIAELWPHGDHWLSHELTRLDHATNEAPPRSTELRALSASLPNHVVFLDLETCGFAGSMIFLVGLIHCQHDVFVLSQLLARNYAEEKSVLQTLWNLVIGKRVLATFNGKSFDWPMVHDRSTVHHLGKAPRTAKNHATTPQPVELESTVLQREDPRPELLHCDLLHHARRRWKNKLPNCKLQTLEQHICRRRRSDDIPGREIPAAYHDFVRSGDAWLIRSVLHHNALDLVTLLQLSIRLIQ